MNTPTPPILTKTPNKHTRKVKALTSSISPKFSENPKIKPGSLNLSSSSAFKHNFKPSTFTDIPPSHEEVLKQKALTSTIRPSFSIKTKSTPLSISSSSAFSKKTLGGKYKKSRKLRKLKKSKTFKNKIYKY
jgi:hypothetical protein